MAARWNLNITRSQCKWCCRWKSTPRRIDCELCQQLGPWFSASAVMSSPRRSACSRFYLLASGLQAVLGEDENLRSSEPGKRVIENSFHVAGGDLFPGRFLRMFYFIIISACDVQGQYVVQRTTYTDHCPAEVRSPGSATLCTLAPYFC